MPEGMQNLDKKPSLEWQAIETYTRDAHWNHGFRVRAGKIHLEPWRALRERNVQIYLAVTLDRIEIIRT